LKQFVAQLVSNTKLKPLTTLRNLTEWARKTEKEKRQESSSFTSQFQLGNSPNQLLS